MYHTVLWGWGLKEPSQRRLIQRSLGPRGLKNWPKEPGPKEPGQKGLGMPKGPEKSAKGASADPRA